MQQMTQEGSVLQCQRELTKKISFKPSNVLSKAHRTLTLAVRKRAVKGSRIKKYAETIDPEKVCLCYVYTTKYMYPCNCHIFFECLCYFFGAQWPCSVV